MLKITIITLVFISPTGEQCPPLMLPPFDFFIVYLQYLYLFTLGVGESFGYLE